MDVSVWDMYPGLTEEEALIGEDIWTLLLIQLKVECINSDFESGERTRVPEGKEDKRQHNFHAVTEDVCISYSETVASLNVNQVGPVKDDNKDLPIRTVYPVCFLIPRTQGCISVVVYGQIRGGGPCVLKQTEVLLPYHI
jgi:hypothetical protein